MSDMNEELDKRLKQDIIGALSRVQLYDVTQAGEDVIEDEADKLVKRVKQLLLKARIDELEHVKPNGDGKAYVSKQDNPHIYILLSKRLTTLREQL